MRLGYDLIIEQTQKLAMTPELIQAIQILQLNTIELEEFVQKELIENPVLELDSALNLGEAEKRKEKELDKDMELRETVSNNDFRYDDISYREWHSETDDETTFEEYTSKETTLLDELLLQLSLSKLEGLDRKIGRFIVEAIDDNGYLTISAEDISGYFNVSIDHVEDVLDVIQTFDPSGVGARTLEECLAIQLRDKGLLEKTVEYVLLNHLKDIADNRLNVIAKATGLTLQEVQIIADLIKSLEPKPGREYASSNVIRYIVPDVTVQKDGDGFSIVSNDDIIPNLVVSGYYKELLKKNPNDKELSRYVNEKYDAANWLIRSIEQRRNTIYNVCTAVLDRQVEFFLKGPRYLKTMTLKDIAEDVGVHESTVSRTINGKFMQTPRGIFEVK
ncbi:MAG: RNA polymerase factor sigma-54, partial [Clostridia bacterium]|nr:RNA polymerase factor sigma-54 [Clostridia bacterium]